MAQAAAAETPAPGRGCEFQKGRFWPTYSPTMNQDAQRGPTKAFSQPFSHQNLPWAIFPGTTDAKKVACLWSMLVSVLEASPSSGGSLEWGENIEKKEKGWGHGIKGACMGRARKTKAPLRIRKRIPSSKGCLLP